MLVADTLHPVGATLSKFTSRVAMGPRRPANDPHRNYKNF